MKYSGELSVHITFNREEIPADNAEDAVKWLQTTFGDVSTDKSTATLVIHRIQRHVEEVMADGAGARASM